MSTTKRIFFSASVDTSRIIRESDFEKLDQCIPFLIRSSIGNLLNVRILDPAIARIYIISQLCLQYLLFCTKFLDKSVYSLRENIFSYQKKTQKLEELIEKRDEEIAQLQKKLKRQDALNQPIFPCTKCTKNFLSSVLLDNHILRKHPPAPVQESKDKDSNLINTIKLELEIKQLKEKLNITEKELMETAGKSMECERCLKNAERKFHSIGIQSNFEEKEKDDIEKDAVMELLNKQMQHFEEWKHGEETRYHSEISELRTKLDSTIEILQQSARRKEVDPPSPAPRHIAISEKCIGISKSIESLIEPRTDELTWKTRYEELEKMYAENQQRMSSTVKSMEKMYNEKMTKIEESVKHLEEEKTKTSDEFKENEGKLKLSAERPKVPITPKVLTLKSTPMYAQESSSENSDESADEDKIESIPFEKKVEVPKQLEKPKTVMETFSAQKFAIRHKKQKPKMKPQTMDDQAVHQISTRERAEEIFNERLHMLGIAQHQERMTKKEFNRVNSDLADVRDVNMKKNKSFFITRKKLQSKVEKIFHQKQKPKDNHEMKPKNEQATNSPKTSKHAVAATVMKSQMHQSPSEMNKSPTLSINRAFRDNLEQMLERGLPPSTQKKNHLMAVPSSSKKNVKFMDDENVSKRIQEIRELNEDDSDYDISDFSTEVEEARIRESFK